MPFSLIRSAREVVSSNLVFIALKEFFGHRINMYPFKRYMKASKSEKYFREKEGLNAKQKIFWKATDLYCSQTSNGAAVNEIRALLGKLSLALNLHCMNKRSNAVLRWPPRTLFVFIPVLPKGLSAYCGPQWRFLSDGSFFQQMNFGQFCWSSKSLISEGIHFYSMFSSLFRCNCLQFITLFNTNNRCHRCDPMCHCTF